MFVRFIKTSTLNLRVVNRHHRTKTIDSSNKTTLFLLPCTKFLTSEIITINVSPTFLILLSPLPTALSPRKKTVIFFIYIAYI